MNTKQDLNEDAYGGSALNVQLGNDMNKSFDFEMDSRPPEQGGETLCGKLGRKHRMKRIHHSKTICVFDSCNGLC